MGYLICENCNIYYKVTREEAEEFRNCGECGSTLIYFESLENYYNTHGKIYSYKKRKPHRTYTESKAAHYNYMGNFGILVIFIGIVLLFFNPIPAIFLIIAGFAITSESNNNKYTWNRGAEGERRMSNHLHMLPESYHVFNDLKIPGLQGNIDHVVIGPTGIFVIETKNYSTPYLIRNDKWYYKTRNGPKLADHNPGKQVRTNTVMLKRLLIKNGIIDERYPINSIVALNRQVTIKGKLVNYNIIKYEDVNSHILNMHSHLEEKIIIETTELLKEFAKQEL